MNLAQKGTGLGMIGMILVILSISVLLLIKSRVEFDEV